MKVDFKSIGIKAAAIGGALAAIWLAVKPEAKSESSDLLADLPELDGDEPAPAEEAAEETETETGETEEPTEEETKEA